MIDYEIINSSIQFYDSFGFKRIESPWTVTKAVSDITRPENASDYTIVEKNKVLVASGEQSFLYLYLKGFLPKGKFQTVTPCFRNDTFDNIHTKYFIKNELIDTQDVSIEKLKDMINISIQFFSLIFKSCAHVHSICTSEFSYDIMCGDVELGSYGIRECDYLKWIYGTGCAEPRTSSLLTSIKGLK